MTGSMFVPCFALSSSTTSFPLGLIPFGSDTPKLASALMEIMLGYGESLYPQAAQCVGADVSLSVFSEVSASGYEQACG